MHELGDFVQVDLLFFAVVRLGGHGRSPREGGRRKAEGESVKP
jgi:hypothetical protein